MVTTDTSGSGTDCNAAWRGVNRLKYGIVVVYLAEDISKGVSTSTSKGQTQKVNSTGTKSYWGKFVVIVGYDLQ